MRPGDRRTATTRARSSTTPPDGRERGQSQSGLEHMTSGLLAVVAVAVASWPRWQQGRSVAEPAVRATPIRSTTIVSERPFQPSPTQSEVVEAAVLRRVQLVDRTVVPGPSRWSIAGPSGVAVEATRTCSRHHAIPVRNRQLIGRRTAVEQGTTTGPTMGSVTRATAEKAARSSSRTRRQHLRPQAHLRLRSCRGLQALSARHGVHLLT